MKPLRRIAEQCVIDHLGADHRVGADAHALVTLDTHIGVPHGHLLGDIAFFVLRGARRPRTVVGHRRNGDCIPPVLGDFLNDVCDKRIEIPFECGFELLLARNARGHLNLEKVG